MIKDIVKDTFILCQKSTAMKEEDTQVIIDLKDTLLSHREHCVGMAANMIGICKQAIVFYDRDLMYIMLNPVIMKKENPYSTSEGCLCHTTETKVTRYHKIKVAYLDENFKKKIKTYDGFTAQIIQHEMDHLKGILV